MKIHYITHKNDFFYIRSKWRKERYEYLQKLSNYIISDLEEEYNYEKIKDTDILCVTHECLLINNKNIGFSGKKMPQKLYDNNMLYKCINNYDKENKYIMLCDTHEYTWGSFKIIANNINKYYGNVICLYDNQELNHIKKFLDSDINIYILSHHIETNIFKDYQLPKTYDITLYGVCDPISYPFRARLKNILLKLDKYIKINIVNPPQWNDYNNNVSGINLVKIINQSKITIATKSKYDYLVLKYFEISGCKSLLMGNMPPQGKKIWTDNYIEINENMSDNEIVNIINTTINKYNSNNKEILNKLDKIYNIIQNEYNLEKYYQKLYHILTMSNIIKLETTNWNLDGWSISKELFSYIINHINFDQTLLELGSGHGTRLLSKYYKIYSVEDDVEWLNKYHNNYLNVPLKNVNYTDFPNDKYWYDPEILRKKIKNIDYDVLLIDGPKNYRGGLYHNINLFKKDIVYIFDDIHHIHHKTLLDKVAKELNKEYKIFTSDNNSSFAILK